MDRSKVVWTEGLFLRPQHFQQQDRYAEGLVRDALRTVPLPAYGFSRLKLDEGSLASGLFGLEEAAGTLPDGTPFHLGTTTGRLDPVMVLAEAEAGLVRIGIPAEQAGQPTVEPSHSQPAGARYRGEVAAVADAIQGGGREEIEIARLAARLLLPGDATDGYVALPVARLRGRRSDGSLVVDEGYIAPAVRTGAMPIYARILREMVAGLDQIITAQSGLLSGQGGASHENLMILELANGARPRLAHFLAQDAFHPSELFLELAGLAGRMATFGSQSRRMNELIPYDHFDPQPAFQGLVDTIKSMIPALCFVEANFKALKVSKYDQNIWTVRLDNPDLLRKGRIVVRVASKTPNEVLRRLFVDQCTVGGAGDFEALWTVKMQGIPLRALQTQVDGLPYKDNPLCLELDRSSELWDKLASAPGFVIGVSGELEREPDIDAFLIFR